jgi:hypothetical protein
MKTSHASVMQTHLFTPTAQFLQKIDENVHGIYKMLTNPQNTLKLLGIGLLTDFSFAISLAQSRLAKIPEVRDFESIQCNNTLKMLAYIDEPNEEVENKIYSVYGEILNLFPDKEIDVRIVELFGRTKADMETIIL